MEETSCSSPPAFVEGSCDPSDKVGFQVLDTFTYMTVSSL